MGSRKSRGGARKLNRGARGGSTEPRCVDGGRSRSGSPKKGEAARSQTKANFGVGQTMRTAKFQFEERRQQTMLAEENSYCQDPPVEGDLIEARLVIPGHHLLPQKLEDPSSLDHIRKEHKVWITQLDSEEMVLVITGRSIRPIQNALKAINWAIHDMRLSEDSQSSKVFVQLPQRNCDDIPIRFDLNRRPALVINKTNNICRENTAGDLKARLSSSLGSSFRGLLACGRLRMRVNLGQIQLLAKKKTTSDQLSWSEYAEALNECSRRGCGASLKTSMPNIHHADELLKYFADNQAGVSTQIRGRHRLEATFPHIKVISDFERAGAPMSPILCMEVDKSPPLQWLMAAPDMSIDWNLQVDSYKIVTEIPASFRALVREFRFLPGLDRPGLDLDLPHAYLRHVPAGLQDVESVEVKTLSTIPFGKTPYEIQVTLTQRWTKVPILGPSNDISWGVSVRAVHWDEALNATYDGAKRNDWGEELRTIWPGEGDLGERISDLIECVLVIQGRLDHIMKASVDGDTTADV